METTLDLTELAGKYAAELHQNSDTSNLVFHNLRHTQELVAICKEIAKETKLDEAYTEALVISAWFYDIGFHDDYDAHIEKSAERAELFLKEAEGDTRQITDQVKEILWDLKNKIPQTDSGKVLADAVTAYYGRKRYERRTSLLELEQKALGIWDPNKAPMSWEKKCLNDLLSHQFYTAYAREKYGERKVANIVDQQSNATKGQKNHLRLKTGKEFGRGIDTMYRTAFRTHINLSSIADGKANMMISINTIVLSIVVALSGAGVTLSETLQGSNKFLIPLTILLLGSLGSVVFAIQSTRPKITKKDLNKDKASNVLENMKKSPLYFGNFLTVDIETFLGYMEDLKRNQDILYDNLATDLYNLGLVLDRKYKLLKICYDIFTVALILSVLSVLPLMWFK